MTTTLDIKQSVTIAAQAICIVADEFGVTTEGISSRKRDRRHSIPRNLIYSLLREFTPLSYPQIGHIIGKRDHTTVMFGEGRAATHLADPEIAGRFKRSRDRVARVCAGGEFRSVRNNPDGAK